MNLTPKQQAHLDLFKSMENTYWCMANDLPQLMRGRIPDFTPDNPEVAPIIKAWDSFKEHPNEDTFGSFINLFKDYGW